MENNKRDYVSELENIEKEMKKLKDRKQSILDEEKKKKSAEKEARKSEVEKAYNNFIKLLDEYENDFNEGFICRIYGEFDTE